jgi:carbon-monoxide dehydrogenase medium subunit
MSLWQHYHTPTTLAEALSILAGYGGAARVVAGGTDLLIEMQQGHAPAVEALVDVTRIDALRVLERMGDHLVIGAAVTHDEIVASSLLQTGATCLVESCGVVGGPQVRNVATLGGNVAHALPAADGTIALLALDAEAQVARWLDDQVALSAWQPLASLFTGPGRSTIDPVRELIVAFRCQPASANSGSAFGRVMRPQGVALPILGMAVRVTLAADRETLHDVAIAVGPAGPVPFRAHATEDHLRGRRIDEALADTVHCLQAEAHVRTSAHRATADYRHEMLGVLLHETLPRAVRRGMGVREQG